MISTSLSSRSTSTPINRISGPRTSSSPFNPRNQFSNSSNSNSTPASIHTRNLHSTPTSTPNSALRNRNTAFNASVNGSGGTAMGMGVSSPLAASAPPASALQRLPYADYTDLIKTVLRLRLRRIYALSFLLTHSLLCLSTFQPFSPLSSLFNFVSPSILALSFLAWLIAVLPLLVSRKWEIQGKVDEKARPESTTAQQKPIVLVQGDSNSKLEFWKSKAGEIVAWNGITTSLSGLILAMIFTFTLYLLQPSYYSPSASEVFNQHPSQDFSNYSWWFQKASIHRKLDPPRVSTRPNERVFYLFFANAIFGLIYHLSISLSTKKSTSFSRIPIFDSLLSLTLRERLHSRISKSLVSSLTISMVSPAILVFYWLTRRSILQFIVSIIGETSQLRRVLIPDTRLGFLTSDLLSRSFLLSFASSMIWQIGVGDLWSIYSTQPVLVSGFSKDKNRGLVGGLKATVSNNREDQFLSNYAFAELALLTSTSSERRKEIYSDVGIYSPATGGSPMNGISSSPGPGRDGAWKAIFKECMLVLEKELRGVKTGGKAPNEKTVASNTLYPTTPNIDKSKHSSPGRNIEVHDPEKLRLAVKTPKKNIWDTISASPNTSTSHSPSSTSLVPQKAVGLLPDSVTKMIGMKNETPASKPSSSTPVASKQTSSTQTSPQFSSLFTLPFSTFLPLFHLLPSDLLHFLRPIISPLLSHLHSLLLPSPTLILKRFIPDPTSSSRAIWAASSLTELSVNSIEEDNLGILQADLVPIMERFADLLEGLEGRVGELRTQLTDNHERRKAFVNKVFKNQGKETEDQEKESKEFNDAYLNHTLPLIVELRNGLNRIEATFRGFDLRGNSELIREKIERARGV